MAIGIPGLGSFEATRTREDAGEGMLTDAEFGDPFALVRQMTVARFNHTSASGNEQAQANGLPRGAPPAAPLFLQAVEAGPKRPALTTGQDAAMFSPSSRRSGPAPRRRKQRRQ